MKEGWSAREGRGGEWEGRLERKEGRVLFVVMLRALDQLLKEVFAQEQVHPVLVITGIHNILGQVYRIY